MPRYFVEVRAIFKDGLYVVEEMLREPTRKIPRFIKVSKSTATTGIADRLLLFCLNQFL